VESSTWKESKGVHQVAVGERVEEEKQSVIFGMAQSTIAVVVLTQLTVKTCK
jgi:hypothetical protein